MINDLDLELSAPQACFLKNLDTKFRGFVGGFGSGKTFVGCLDLIFFASRNPGVAQGYFGPSYPAIRDIFYPTIVEAGEMLGFTVKVREGNKEVDLYRGSLYYGTIICRSMDKPESIVGFKIARALVDEIDIFPQDKAKKAWDKIIARLRLVVPGVVNGVGVTTTPEGFKFTYQQFANQPTKSYSMVQASTFENEEYLPPDYIDTLYETYTPELADAYVLGNFVNLTSGTVYRNYDRIQHRSNETVRPGEPLFIGCDFNVTKMAATVWVKRNGGKEWHAVDEFHSVYDTPEMIHAIKAKYEEVDMPHPIYVYPDASGKSRKTVDASTSDIALLEQAGFTVRAKSKNPPVKDRIQATNSAFARGVLYINDRVCKQTANCLEQQAYGNNGEPDKTSGHDHQNDATTYPIAYEMPIIKPVSNIIVNF